jgi:uncharacterized protein (TIRG00374 family)
MKLAADPKLNRRLTAWLPRLLGLALLALLLLRLDLRQVQQVIREANLLLTMASILAVVPLILVKTIRWQGILRSQAVQFRLWPAFMAYFGSLFIGLLTPGRLGEFVKALHVSQGCKVPSARAFSSVLADRLLDLYALLLVSCLALLSLATGRVGTSVILGSIAMTTIPIVLFLNKITYSWLQHTASKLGRPGQRLFAPGGWLYEMRLGLRQLTFSGLLAASGLTVFAYLIFFGQCYLLALALKLPVGFVPVSYAVALGSLVTLLPISISGLGTREAAMIAYLGTVGVSAEAALGFSLFVFLTFYVAGGLMGSVAWWIKPIDLENKTSP